MDYEKLSKEELIEALKESQDLNKIYENKGNR